MGEASGMKAQGADESRRVEDSLRSMHHRQRVLRLSWRGLYHGKMEAAWPVWRLRSRKDAVPIWMARATRHWGGRSPVRRLGRQTNYVIVSAQDW